MTHFYGDSYRSMNCRLQHLPVASTGRGAPSGVLGSSNVLGGCHAVASIIEAARGTSGHLGRGLEGEGDSSGPESRGEDSTGASSGQGVLGARGRGGSSTETGPGVLEAGRARGSSCSGNHDLGETNSRYHDLEESRPRARGKACSGSNQGPRVDYRGRLQGYV